MITIILFVNFTYNKTEYKFFFKLKISFMINVIMTFYFLILFVLSVKNYFFKFKNVELCRTISSRYNAGPYYLQHFIFI